MIPEATSNPWRFRAATLSKIGVRRFWVFFDGPQGCGFGCFNAAEDGLEAGLPHEFENLRMAGKIQRCLARQLDAAIVLLLPVHEMGQQFQGCLWIGNEIIVHEIDRVCSSGKQLIQFVENLPGRLHPRISTVESGDVAKLAGERAAAGELHTAHQILFQINELIGGRRKFHQPQPFRRVKHNLPAGSLDGLIQILKQPERAIPHLSAVQQIHSGIIFRRSRNGRAAQTVIFPAW